MAEAGGEAPDHLSAPGQADGLQGGAQLRQHWGKVGTEASFQSDGNWQLCMLNFKLEFVDDGGCMPSDGKYYLVLVTAHRTTTSFRM